jgi:hypothetical protein
MPVVNQYSGTLMHPVIAVGLIGFIVGLFVLRPSMILPLLVAGLLIFPVMHRIDIATINLSTHRILVIAALLASLMRTSANLKWQNADLFVIVWLLAVALSTVVRSGLQTGLISFLAYSGDCAFAYLVARREIKSVQDIDRISRVVALSAIVVVVPGLIEWSLRWNPWSVFGGIRAIPEIRDGVVRSQGNSPHPILFGTQWVLMFLVIALSGNQGRSSLLKKAGLAASFGLAVLSFSSTSWSILVVAVILLPMAMLRNHLRWILTAFFLSLIPLHFMMNGPVWSLFARVNVFSSSTGWHRYALIDHAINRFSEWYLFGLNSTAHWGWGMWDCTNTFLLNGLRGGFIAMLAFFLILGIAFLRSIRAAECSPGNSLNQRSAIGWGFCVFFIGSTLAMLSVAFYGPIWILLFIVFAAAVSWQRGDREFSTTEGGCIGQFGQPGRSRRLRSRETRGADNLGRGENVIKESYGSQPTQF